MKKYQNKYRIPSARKPGWDYRNAGAYFITICTKDRRHFFGEVKDQQMVLSTMGAVVQGFWFEIPKHFDHVRLGEFVVMPNHIHGILILDDGMNEPGDDDVETRQSMNDVETRQSMNDVETRQCMNDVETRQCHVSTETGNPTPDRRNAPGFYRRITPQSGSVSVIIGSYKSICTRHIRRTWPEVKFGWQERFHDHIIHDDRSFQTISQYILNNPQKWKADRFFIQRQHP